MKMVRLWKLRVDFIPEDQILSLMNSLTKSKDREEKIKNELLTSNIIKICKQIIYTIIITYILGCFWYRMSDRLNPPDEVTFIENFNLKDKTTVG